MKPKTSDHTEHTNTKEREKKHNTETIGTHSVTGFCEVIGLI